MRYIKMSRRTIFLFAAAVVMLYFSIILFMLSPLHGTKSAYYGNNYMNHFGFRQIPSVNWCHELRWQSPPSQHVVALASYPGSGNTWFRYLLQQATGIVTGSVYMDYGLRVHGFPAENVTDGSVLVVKTHEAPPAHSDKFKSAILLIRNPRDAILADFNRLHKGHIGTAPKSAFKRISHDKKTEWWWHVRREVVSWEALHRAWLAGFRGALLVLRYEQLAEDPGPPLQAALAFLNRTVPQESLECALANKEGIYRRRNKHQNFDPFTPQMYELLDAAQARVAGLVARRTRDVTTRPPTRA